MFLRFLLPDLSAVSRRSQRAVTAATLLMFALLAINIAHTQFGLGGSGLDTLLNAWGQNLVLACACAVVAVRVATGGAPGCKPLLAGMVLWTVGNLWWGLRPLRHGRRAVPVPGRRRLARLLPLRLPLPRPAPARQLLATSRAAPGSTA